MSKQGEHGIAWTDETWNPIRGCSPVSAGCKNCWAARMATRFRWGEGFAWRLKYPAGGKPGRPRWTGRVELIPDQLDKPLRWRKPRRIAVALMGDLFHDALSDEDVARVFAIMRSATRHTFQVLTKRPRRMREWFSRCGNGGGLGWITHNNTEPEGAYLGTGIVVGADDRWPLPNVHLGVSVEDQATADERIPLLLQTPAAVRWVSYEPALGPVDFQKVCRPLCPQCHGAGEVVDSEEGGIIIGCPCERLVGLSWLVIGGESGPGARPCNVEWIRSAVRQCREAGVACFVKQLGSRCEYPGPKQVLSIHDPECTYLRLCTDWDGETSWVKTKHPKGGDPAEWPEDLRVREFPS